MFEAIFPPLYLLYKDVGLNGGDKLKYGHKCVKINWNNWLTTVCKYKENTAEFSRNRISKQTSKLSALCFAGNGNSMGFFRVNTSQV